MPNWTYTAKERERFDNSKRLYLETSAFNFLADNVNLPDLELTRAYQRRKGVVFVTSPMLLWEIMLITDRERADYLLMAAQALFDPCLLGTPTELTVRFLRHACPNNVVNYETTTELDIGRIWREMATDFGRTFEYDLSDLLTRTKPLRAISKNLPAIIEGRSHDLEIVNLTSEFVTTVYRALATELEEIGIDGIEAKFVILYAHLLLMAYADLDGSAARTLWAKKGYDGAHAQVTLAFIDYPDMFRLGPLLTMASMAALQYRNSSMNRGVLFDGMHMIYAPYVDVILSADHAFLDMAQRHAYFRRRVLHLSEFEITRVPLPLSDYPDDQKLRSL